jgi:uncharacterized protein YbjT (DUF2867 family)
MKRERTALIVGATGLVGGHLLRLLLQRPEYARVRAMVRRPWQQVDSKLEVRVVNFEALPEVPGMFGCDDVFCCLGTTIAQAGSQEAFRRVDRDYPKMIAQRALKQGASQFLLVSSVGADPKSKNFYLRTKGEVEHEVAALPFEVVQIFRPSMLLGERREFRWKESIAEPVTRVLSPFMVGGLRRYRPIHAETVAKAMASVPLEQGNGRVRIYEYEDIQAAARAFA